MKRAKRARGFTLVEILVVLAVVVVLASLLFAAFSRVRENGRKAACQSNLKHLALAVQQYVQDNNGRYPHFGAEIQGLLPYVKDPQMYFCPSLNQNGILQFGYAPNIERLNRLMSTSPSYLWIGRREAALAQVATIWLHSDNGENSNYVAVSSSCGFLRSNGYWAEVAFWRRELLISGRPRQVADAASPGRNRVF